MSPSPEGNPSPNRVEYERAKAAQQDANTTTPEAMFAGRKLSTEERQHIRLTNRDFQFVESALKGKLNQLRDAAEERLQGVLGKHQEEAQELNERYEGLLDGATEAFMTLHDFEQSPAGASQEQDDVDQHARLTNEAIEALMKVVDYEHDELGMNAHDTWVSLWKKFEDEAKDADEKSA